MRQITLLLAVCLATAAAARADVKSLTIDATGKIIVNDQPIRLWGLRTACAATSDESTKQLIDSLKGHQSAGINLLLICYQGGAGLSSKAFSPDGKRFDDVAVRDRMRRSVQAAAGKDMLVAASLFYPRKSSAGRQDPRLPTPPPSPAACRPRAEALPWREDPV